MIECLHCQGGLAQGGGGLRLDLCRVLQAGFEHFYPLKACVQILRTQKLLSTPHTPSFPSWVKSKLPAELSFSPVPFIKVSSSQMGQIALPSPSNIYFWPFLCARACLQTPAVQSQADHLSQL